MHAALINRWYPPHTGYGGVAVYNYYLAHALVKLGHQVTVIAARWSPEVPAFEDDRGVKVYRILAQDHYRLRRLPLLRRYVRAVQQLLYSRQIVHRLRLIEQPDVVEFAEVNAEGFLYLQDANRAKVVVRCHTPTFVLRNYYRPSEMPYNTSIISAMEKYCIGRADILTAPSQDMAQTIAIKCDLPVEKISVIPNALDVDLFSPDKNQQWNDYNRITVLHVGRLDRAKGIEVLARAIPLVFKFAPQTRFVFVGDDRPDGNGSTWQRRLETYFEKEGVHNSVVFTGGVDQATLIEWYHQADIAVVPSILYESFSYTCAQAMAAGLPVVATCIGGIPETIGDCGFLIPIGNVEALVEAVVNLICHAELRYKLGKQGRQRVKDSFEAVNIAAQMTGIYLA